MDRALARYCAPREFLLDDLNSNPLIQVFSTLFRASATTVTVMAYGTPLNNPSQPSAVQRTKIVAQNNGVPVSQLLTTTISPKH